MDVRNELLPIEQLDNFISRGKTSEISTDHFITGNYKAMRTDSKDHGMHGFLYVIGGSGYGKTWFGKSIPIVAAHKYPKHDILSIYIDFNNSNRYVVQSLLRNVTFTTIIAEVLYRLREFIDPVKFEKGGCDLVGGGDSYDKCSISLGLRVAAQVIFRKPLTELTTATGISNTREWAAFNFPAGN